MVRDFRWTLPAVSIYYNKVGNQYYWVIPMVVCRMHVSLLANGEFYINVDKSVGV